MTPCHITALQKLSEHLFIYFLFFCLSPVPIIYNRYLDVDCLVDQEESMLRLTGLEADKQRLSAEVGHEQRLIHDERGLVSQLQLELLVF